jgi:hypothetical protein
MKIVNIFLAVISVLMILMLFFYWVVPTEKIVYGIENNNDNFSLEGNLVLMQFYENMRFPDSKISYSISENCSIRKKSDMKWAFDIVENETVLEFYEVSKQGEIFIFCEERNKVKEGLFIAGEGGPTNITNGEKFNVILNGQILLIKNSDCQKPNVAIHELLHVMGFNHSDNPNNLMYPVSRCEQTISNDIIEEINRLYSIPSYSDLMVRKVSAQTHGMYLDLNVSLFNDGFKIVDEPVLFVFADAKEIKKTKLPKMKIGGGLNLEFTNIPLKKIKIEELKIKIESNQTELSLENNEVILTKI